jgi:cytochrome c oxidase subunit 2
VNHSVLRPFGDQATWIAELWWVFFFVSLAVYAAVVVVALLAVRRALRAPEAPSAAESSRLDPLAARAIGFAVALSIALIALLLVFDFAVGRAVARDEAPALTIDVVGHQWWWEVTYDDPQPSRRFNTANELHVPAGRRVALRLTASDVIHSFWVPSLRGKTDLIPGYWRTMTFVPREPGTFYGQCAEFCGLQHANMKLLVHVDEPERFEAWRAAQLAPAATPAGDTELRGAAVFRRAACVLCHTVRGTNASAQVGPDLTHLASRSTLAAGVLENSRAQLRTWVRRPQYHKPGVRMPPSTLDDGEVEDLVSYLESLR